MVIFNGHISNINDQFLTTYFDLQILPVGLPYDTSHISQPLNVSYYLLQTEQWPLCLFSLQNSLSPLSLATHFYLLLPCPLVRCHSRLPRHDTKKLASITQYSSLPLMAPLYPVRCIGCLLIHNRDIALAVVAKEGGCARDVLPITR